MNIVLDEAIEEKPDGEKVRIGMVVCLTKQAHILSSTEITNSFVQVIRGNSVVMLEVRSNKTNPSLTFLSSLTYSLFLLGS